MEVKIETLKDLRDFLNALNDIQLAQRACVMQEDSYVNIDTAQTLEEEWIYPLASEGSFPLADYDPAEWNDEPANSNENVIIPIGTVRLHEDF